MGMQKRGLGLVGNIIPRAQPRQAEQRAEPRHADLVDRATISLRGQRHLVPVVNISSRGTMIECEVLPRIGEAVLIQFENCCRIHGFVRWVRDGRVGLSFGHEIVMEKVGK
jgi:hypothetical protein